MLPRTNTMPLEFRKHFSYCKDEFKFVMTLFWMWCRKENVVETKLDLFCLCLKTVYREAQLLLPVYWEKMAQSYHGSWDKSTTENSRHGVPSIPLLTHWDSILRPSDPQNWRTWLSSLFLYNANAKHPKPQSRVLSWMLKVK